MTRIKYEYTLPIILFIISVLGIIYSWQQNKSIMRISVLDIPVPSKIQFFSYADRLTVNVTGDDASWAWHAKLLY